MNGSPRDLEWLHRHLLPSRFGAFRHNNALARQTRSRKHDSAAWCSSVTLTFLSRKRARSRQQSRTASRLPRARAGARSSQQRTHRSVNIEFIHMNSMSPLVISETRSVFLGSPPPSRSANCLVRSGTDVNAFCFSPDTRELLSSLSHRKASSRARSSACFAQCAISRWMPPPSKAPSRPQ